MPVKKILETSLYVRDLDRSAEFYRELLQAEKIAGDQRFVALAIGGQNVLLLFKQQASDNAVATPGGIIPGHGAGGGAHVAFAIPAESMAEWQARLAERGIAIESHVTWPRGGHSLYFYDADRNLIELATPGLW